MIGIGVALPTIGSFYFGAWSSEVENTDYQLEERG